MWRELYAITYLNLQVATVATSTGADGKQYPRKPVAVQGWHEELSPRGVTAENALAGVNQSTGQNSDEICKAVYKKVDMRDIYRSIKSMTKDEAKAFAGFVRLSVAAHIGEPGFLDIVGCEAK